MLRWCTAPACTSLRMCTRAHTHAVLGGRSTLTLGCTMNALRELQAWYFAHCDGDWEHEYGVDVGTLDNPGWSLDVDLTDTELSGIPFEELAYGVGKDAGTSGNNWIHCKVEGNKFVARGGPENLEELVGVFLEWARRSLTIVGADRDTLP